MDIVYLPILTIDRNDGNGPVDFPAHSLQIEFESLIAAIEHFSPKVSAYVESMTDLGFEVLNFRVAVYHCHGAASALPPLPF